MIKFFKIFFFISFFISSSLFAQEMKNRDSWGFEINPVSITMLGTGSDTKVFSGVLSHFNQEDATEMALSLVYLRDYYVFGGSLFHEELPSKVMNMAFHYRKFVGQRTKGFYYGGFGAYTYLDGKLKNDIRFATVEKIGLGGEIGVRLMKSNSDWSFYWGPALRMGGYLGSNNDVFEDNGLGFELYDRDFFIDIDFMRIGFRF